MPNRMSFWRMHLSVSIALGLAGLVPQLPVLAQVPSFVEPGTGSVSFANSSYVLGPGDEIQLNVFQYEEYTGTSVILPDGTITLPLLGKVMAANRTPAQLTQELTRRLQSWLVNPVVSVNITKFRPLLVNVAGEVQRPGPLQLTSVTNATINPNGTSSVQLPTVSIALLAAGGVTRDADIRNVVLKRSNPTGNSPTVVINLWDSLFSENTPRDLVLQDGDALFVPKLAAGDSLDRRLVARSSFAPRTVRVRVVGEVKNPGELEIPPNSSLSSAVAIAGGPTDKAKLSNVRFVRMNEDGILEEQSVDLSNLTDSYQIQEGDVIVVPKSNTYTALDIASDLFNPLNLILNLFK